MSDTKQELWAVGSGFMDDEGGECIHTEDGLWIGEFYHQGKFEDDDEPSVPVDYKAHARLAAAAPKMLAELSELKAEVLKLRAFLDNEEDVLDGTDGPRPNDAMRYLTAGERLWHLAKPCAAIAAAQGED